jgi:hypothetical protein
MIFEDLPKFKQNIGLMMTSTLGVILWGVFYLASLFLTVFLVNAIIIGALGWPYIIYLIGCGLAGFCLGWFVVSPPWKWRALAKDYLAQKTLDITPNVE